MEPQDFKNKQAGFVFELIEKHQQQQMKYLRGEDLLCIHYGGYDVLFHLASAKKKKSQRHVNITK